MIERGMAILGMMVDLTDLKKRNMTIRTIKIVRSSVNWTSRMDSLI